MMKRLLSRAATMLLLLLAAATTAEAQVPVYCGEHKYDGEHNNEVSGYLQLGNNIVTGKYIGPAVTYTRHLNSHFTAEAGLDLPFGKGKAGFYTKGSYRLSASYFNFYFSGKLLYNRYTDFHTNEYNANLSTSVETPYFDLTLGETLIHYSLMGTGYTEPLTLTFGTGVNIRPRWNSWNLGLFLRNYDDFYYENWNINWGVRWMANLRHRMKLYGELNIRPAGSTSQLATRYEASLKIGLKYVW